MALLVVPMPQWLAVPAWRARPHQVSTQAKAQTDCKTLRHRHMHDACPLLVVQRHAAVGLAGPALMTQQQPLHKTSRPRTLSPEA
jgi:hypothetical protein